MTLPHSTLSPLNITHALWKHRQGGNKNVAEPFIAQEIVEDVLALDIVLFSYM